MSAAVATETRAAIRRPELARSAQRLFEPSRSTLEDTILGAWEDLAAAGRTECPVCREDALAAGGCTACGAHLS